MPNQSTQSSGLDIAVIAVSGRFPKANSVDEFWENLQNAVESVSEVNEQELSKSGINSNLFNEPNYVKAASTLDNYDLFDANFFGVNPREAEYMDPQNRLFLECAWEALETAGYDPERYEGLIGVYAGSSENTYLINHLAQIGKAQITDGGCRGFLATGTSYKLNLKGPSLYIQTFCSTSMVAIHLACQSLLNDECDMALAGGVSVRIPHHVGYLYGEGGIVSPDGHCRAFDADAQGTIFGSGVGIVVLKRLEDAIADHDHIEAVIKGSAINNDGSLKVSFAAPSVDGQADVIAEALAIADINPETITYIEAHGTGTNIGDPVEVMALTQAFRSYTQKREFCAIGSLKSNIGHLDAAAGVASLIKTVLALKHQKIPPTLHVKTPNPKIDFPQTPFYVNTALREWITPNGIPRRAGVSSLGVGGTNAHVILEEAPEIDLSDRSSRLHQLLILSAKSETALDRATQNLSKYLKANPSLDIADVAFTLQLGRRAFGYRQMLVCESLESAVGDLLVPGRSLTQYQDVEDRQVVFMFSGQGSQQYMNMGKKLYTEESIFRKHIDYCASFLCKPLELDLRDILYPTEINLEFAEQQLLKPAIAHAAIFAIGYALAQLWMHWGIKPQAIIGHGIGEYVAACLSGVTSLDEALTNLSAKAGSGIKGSPTIYLGQNLLQMLPFSEGIQKLLTDTNSIFLEVGADDGLGDLILRHPLRTDDHPILTALYDSKDRQSDSGSVIKTLGQLWLLGATIDWDNFYEDEERYRVALPTYPFERQCFWIDDPKVIPQAEIVQSDRPSLTKNPDLANWFYMPLWKQTVFPVIQGNETGILDLQNSPNTYWLIFADDLGLSAKLATSLKQNAPSEVIIVKIGSQFAKVSENIYAINPQNPEDYGILLNTLQAIGKQPSKILHLWNLSENICDRQESTSQLDIPIATSEQFSDVQYLGFYSLIFIAQALDRFQMLDHLEIIVISNNLHSVLGNEAICPAKSTLLAPCKTIPQEYPHIRCRSIDIAITKSEEWQSDHLLAQLVQEIISNHNDPIVGYRNYYRWTQSFEPIQVTEVNQPVPLRQNGVYLITGGLGRIGLVLAAYLARTVQAKLILMGRSPFPERQEWDRWMSTHDQEDLISQKIEKLLQIESLGSEISVISVDITDKQEMQGALTQAETKFGNIHGVIHGAGALQNAKFSEISTIEPVDCEQQFQPKVYGLMVLEESLLDRNLDFCLLMSSLSSILGGLGMTAYAAANQFMDSFAIAKDDPKWKSLNWDSWNIEEAKNAVTSKGSSLLEFSMTAKEGSQALEKVLSMTFMPQIAIAVANLPRRYEQWIKPQSKQPDISKNSSEVAIGKTLYARPNLPTAYVIPTNEIEQIILTIWQELLGIEQIGIHDNFFSLGGDSFMLIQVRQRLQTALTRSIPTVDLFEYPTIGSLATFLGRADTNSVKAEKVTLEKVSDRASKQRAALEQEANQRLNQHRRER